MTDQLASVKRAARAKTRADAHYRVTIEQALAAGHSFAEIARTLGVSRQAVRQFTQRG